MFGKKVEMFLVNGSAEGVIIAEMSNWNGKAFKLQRLDVGVCDEDELSCVGVYFLFGQAKESGASCVYIGEAEDFLRIHRTMKWKNIALIVCSIIWRSIPVLP